MNKKRTMQCSSLFHGVQKLRCMSETWHHKIQQRLSLDVPPHFNPQKAKTCKTEDLPHVAQPVFRMQLHVGGAAKHVSPEIRPGCCCVLHQWDK